MKLAQWPVSFRTYALLYAAAAFAAGLTDIAWTFWRRSLDDVALFTGVAIMFWLFVGGLLVWLRARELERDIAGYQTGTSMKQELVVIIIASVVGVIMRRAYA
jgi:hypothetical protein